MDLTCFSWIQIIKKHSDLPPNAKFLALYLNTYMNYEHDVAWPSISRISDETGLSRPTVIKYLGVLESDGYLIKGKQRWLGNGGEQEHNTYTINIPDKVVKQLNHLTDKGSKTDTQRWLNSSSKVVKELNPNNNIITNNNNSGSGRKTVHKKTKQRLPNFSDEYGWKRLAREYGIKERAGESWDQFRSRVRDFHDNIGELTCN